MGKFIDSTLNSYRSLLANPSKKTRAEGIISLSESLNYILLENVMDELSHTKVPFVYKKLISAYSKGESLGYKVKENKSGLIIANEINDLQIELKILTPEDLKAVFFDPRLKEEELIFLDIFLSSPNLLLQFSYAIALIKNKSI